MRMPGFTAEASRHKATTETYQECGHRAALGELTPVLPQLGFGGGVTYPPDDNDCYCCLQWARCPCGLGLA